MEMEVGGDCLLAAAAAAIYCLAAAVVGGRLAAAAVVCRLVAAVVCRLAAAAAVCRLVVGVYLLEVRVCFGVVVHSNSLRRRHRHRSIGDARLVVAEWGDRRRT